MAAPARAHVGLDLLYLAPGATGGMETYARMLVPLLPAAFPEARFTVFAGRELAAEWGAEPWHPEIELHGLRVSSDTRIARTIVQQTLLPAAARRAQVDLLHSLGNIAPLAGVRRRVVTIHDLIALSHPETTSGLLARGLGILLPAVARRATHVVADSGATATELRERLAVPAGRITVVPLGPGAPPAAEAVPERELRARLGIGPGPIVLCVAPRRPHKNLGRLIEALRLLPEAELVAPGYPTPYDALLREQAVAAGVADRLHLGTWVTDAELEGLFAAARCLAFPSLAEGFGLPVLEAMTRGLPVACSDTTSLPEVAGDAALLFDPLDPSAIASQVGRLLADDALCARVAEAGRARARTFSWERTARELAAVYSSVLGGSSPAARPA